MYTLCTDVNENADELVKACISVALEPIVMVNSKLHVCSIIYFPRTLSFKHHVLSLQQVLFRVLRSTLSSELSRTNLFNTLHVLYI